MMAAVAAAGALVLFALLRDPGTSQALIPLPVQPFAARAMGGISTNQLGQNITANWTVTQALQGERTTMPWEFSGPGFSVDLDKDITNGTQVGTVWTNVDAICDGTIDYMALDCGELDNPLYEDYPGRASPLKWLEATTAVEGTSDEFLKAIMPPFSWLVRHKVDITHLCLVTGGTSVAFPSVLNTIYAAIPYSPNGSTFVAQTKLGGSPTTPPSTVCLDSPQTSESVTNLYNNPPNEGDLDGVCNPANNQCADAGIYGMWTDDTVLLGATGSKTITVNKHKVNNGPEAGTFKEHWDAETTGTNIEASWVPAGTPVGPIYDQTVILPVNVDVSQTMGLKVTCSAAGTGLVVLKNILFPTMDAGSGQMTKDTYLDDNSSVFVVQVLCGGAVGLPVDKEVVRITPVIPGQNHLKLNAGETVPVMLDELKVNHGGATQGAQIDSCVLSAALASANPGATDVVNVAGLGCPGPVLGLSVGDHILIDNEVMEVTKVPTPPGSTINVKRATPGIKAPAHAIGAQVYRASLDDPVLGREWLVAEFPPEILATWQWGVTFNGSGVSTTSCDSSGNDCIYYDVLEPHGQSDVLAQLNVQCPGTTVPGLYPVVIKAIDDPLPPYTEIKASDNAQRSVISVWCGTGAGTPDGIDDGNGLYARWTIFQSVGSTSLNMSGDLRKPFKSPPSIASDTGYVERTLQLQCFWMDANGCDAASGYDCDLPANGGNGDGIIQPEESMNDPNMPAGIDADGDCLALASVAQPGHPLDAVPAESGDDCPAVPYSENPQSIVYDEAKDQDCDGVPDGVEKAWGANPLLADSDGDGADDFVEMFQFTNPVNPDSDGDGFWDSPANIYGDNTTDPSVDNCPSVANPAQLNSDGKGRWNGSQIPNDYASNPNKDKLGDACDPDNDNDGATDAYEIANGTTLPSKLDTDGDTVNDGAELRLGNVPLWTNLQQTYYRGCHINVNTADYPAFATYSGGGVENDPDGDGIVCPTDQDSDNGTGTGSAPPEISDQIEAYGYNTSISNKDSDGDGCEDWIEIVDLNGNRAADVLDAWLVAKVLPASDSDNVRDIDKGGVPGAPADVALAVSNSQMVKTHAPCDPSPTPGAPNFRLRIDALEDVGGTWCNPVDDAATRLVGGSYQVAICLENPPAAIGAFQAEVTYDDSLSVAPEISCPLGFCLDDNPDANAGITNWGDFLDSGWDCNGADLSEPTGDAGPPTGPGQKRARIACWGPLTSFPGDMGSGGALAVLTLRATSIGIQELELKNVIVGDGNGVERGSCNPDLGVSVPCYGAAIDLVEPLTATPTLTPTPTPTSTPGTPTPGGAVGGIAEAPDMADSPLRATEPSSAAPSAPYAAIAGIAAAAVAIVGGGWYVRRRYGS